MGFDWDDGNWPKCGKHGVTKEDIESLFAGVVDIPGQGRFVRRDTLRAVGVTGEGRHAFLAFTIRLLGERSLIRPISARFMHDKEVRHYEQQKGSRARS
jgi:uncharacterized protein